MSKWRANLPPTSNQTDSKVCHKIHLSLAGENQQDYRISRYFNILLTTESCSALNMSHPLIQKNKHANDTRKPARQVTPTSRVIPID